MVWSSKKVRLAKCDGAKKCLLTNNSPNNKQISCDGELCDRWTHWVCAKPKPLKKHQNRFFCEFCTGKGQRKRNERAAQLEEDRDNAEFMTDESSVQSAVVDLMLTSNIFFVKHTFSLGSGGFHLFK